MEETKTNRRETIAAMSALAGLAATKGWAAMDDDKSETLSAAFDVDALSQANAEEDGPWLEFFDNNTMFSGIYEIPAGGEDRQNPHEFDELYLVTKGRAMLTAGEKSYAAKPGAIFFVKAAIPHRFIEIKEDLQVIVFFSKADPAAG